MTAKKQDVTSHYTLLVIGAGTAGLTGAAIRKQAKTVEINLWQMMQAGKIANPDHYTGYSSCPLLTGYGKTVLAEFDYNNNPMPSFPFNTAKERLSMYMLKKYALPLMYWKAMIKGIVG